MNRELLETPFTPAQIKQRKGRNGMLDYVEGHSVIQRLNEALEGAWSFEIVQHEVREDEVLVLAKLSAEGLVKMNFGVSQVRLDHVVLPLGHRCLAGRRPRLGSFLGVTSNGDFDIKRGPLLWWLHESRETPLPQDACTGATPGRWTQGHDLPARSCAPSGPDSAWAGSEEAPESIGQRSRARVH
jgi:hypothetical protein